MAPWCTEVVESEWPEHRLYVSEVIELGRDVSVIILLPAAHNICSAPGNVDLRHVTTAVPLQIFEISEYQANVFEHVAQYLNVVSTWSTFFVKMLFQHHFHLTLLLTVLRFCQLTDIVRVTTYKLSYRIDDDVVL